MKRKNLAIVAVLALSVACAKDSDAESGKDLLEKAVASAKSAKPTAAAQMQKPSEPVEPGKTKPEPDKAKPEPMAGKTISTDSTYTLNADLPAVKAGKQATLTLQLAPKEGWKINCEFPTKLKVEPPSGMTVEKSKQTIKDRVSCKEYSGSKWAVKFTSEAGQKTLGGLFKFAVCTDATCDPKEVTLAIAVDAK
jgi:hypothetical protein